MKIFAKISVIILASVGIILLVFPVSWFPDFYDVRYMGKAGIAGAAIIIFLPWLLKISYKKEGSVQANQTVNLFQFMLAFAFISNALGDLGLYKLYNYGFEYDKFLHFLNPLLAVVALSFVLCNRWGVRKNYSILMAFAIIFFAGIAWEVYEVLADLLFKTHISGVYGLDVSQDTKFDLLFDFIGSGIGAVYSVYFWKYFSGGENMKKPKIVKGAILAIILAIAIGFYAAYIKM